MAPRREILDSDDDNSDFGDGTGFADAESRQEFEESRDQPHDASHNGSTDSTDPSFFQRIYDQQQAAADSHDGPEVIPDTAPAAEAAVSTWTEISPAPPPGQKPQPADCSSLTFVTDPMPSTRKSKRTRGARQMEVMDLTDVTTPRKEVASGQTDAWDFPSSTGPQRRSIRTYGKRKSTGQDPCSRQEATPGMPPTEDPYDFPDTTPQSRKRAKREIPPSPASPVMLVPTEESPSTGGRALRSRGRNGYSTLDSSMPDTAASLYIAPSELTASQKQAYRVVSPSSDAVPETFEQKLPTQPFSVGETYKSSGATTIAYPTPSRIGSSRLAAESTDVLDHDVVATASPGYDVGHQQSSPDVLTDMSTTHGAKPRKGRIKVVSSVNMGSSELDPPVSTRKPRKRRVVEEEEEDASWGANPSDDTKRRDASPQQAPQAENAADPDPRDQPYAPDDAPINLDTSPAPPLPTTQKKRGRKKKAAEAQEPPPDPHNPAPPATDDIPVPTPEPAEPPAKRKRGRPRKSDTAAKAAEATAITPPPEAQPQPESEAGTEQQTLSELPPNSHSQTESLQPSSAKSNSGGEDKENTQPREADMRQAAETRDEGKEDGDGKAQKQELNAKPGAPAKTQDLKVPQKVQYRVGLSRRSRIAPLLKSLKKV